MSLTSHHLFTNSLPSSRLTVYFNVTLNNHNHKHLSLLPPLNSRHFIHISQRKPLDFTPNSKSYHSLKPLNCHDNTGITPPQTRDNFNLDSLLSISELGRGCWRVLEKLGIRFRVTRKALKEPISQTATLAQKNSEATRTLAMQEEVLEKELGEIQKVLLAMQEQQHKQLDLILAIGKTGKLLESRREPSQEQITLDKSKLADGKTHETQSLGSIKGSKNDRV
ncbi:hypothetical protein QYF36_019527 [Acer negundo]|nr:hypothetical protein QYF36_019527 [Acer negundo]